jgi:hypothetical protein
MAIKIKSVTTPLDHIKIGDVIQNHKYFELERKIATWHSEHPKESFNFEFDLDKIDEILYYPEDRMFEAYSKNILVFTIRSNEYSIKHKEE